jgi:hypothetical protein
MPVRPSPLRHAHLIALSLLAGSLVCSLAFCSSSASAQQPLPDAPQPGPTGTLDLGQRFQLEVHTSLGVSSFLVPVGDALVDMADPPDYYPREWRDGGDAFGRNYGAELVRHTTAGFTHFAVAAIDREDPRYYPSTSTNVARRAVHAIVFTVINRSDSGHRTLAVSNLAGSMAGGAVGMAFYPDGFNDFTHAYQRGAVETTSFAAHNLVAEFSPEIVHALRKCHIPEGITHAFLPATAPVVSHRTPTHP